LGFEVVVKVPARPPASGRIRHSGHRIRLSEDVHETGSSANPRYFIWLGADRDESQWRSYGHDVNGIIQR
jgi:hypothetical protein